MGLSYDLNQRIDEKNTNHASYISESSIDKIYNSIVRIVTGKIIPEGTGFFMKAKINGKLMHFLLTCYHIIPDNLIDNKLAIHITYGKINKEKTKCIKLDKNEGLIKIFKPSLDIVVIEIKDSDFIPEDKYLLPDLNYKNGYDFYKGKGFYLGGYPSEENPDGERCISSGKLLKIYDYEFGHSLDTRDGSSGSFN